MKADWDVYRLSTVVGTDETLYHLADGVVVFRALPFVVQRAGRRPPADAEIVQRWEHYERTRVQVLVGLDWAYTQNAHIYRLSLGFLPRPYDPGDALAIAIRMLEERNRIVVTAAGNWGPKPNTLSELARFPAVIAVGATTPDGALLRLSSRGTPDGAHPTVVADGTCPPVVAEGIDYPEDPFPPGTSFAAVRVADFCVVLRSMLRWLALDLAAVAAGTWTNEKPPPSRLAHLDTGFNRPALEAMIGERRAKMIVMEGDAGVEWSFGLNRRDWLGSILEAFRGAALHFDVSNSPATIRRLLALMADPRPCGESVGCGAGFLSQELFFQFLRDMTPSRFYAAFGEDDRVDRSCTNLLTELDKRHGPLWDGSTFALTFHEYYNKHDDVFARVL